MAKRKKPRPAVAPRCFFERELAGEEPPTLATGQRLCELAGMLAPLQPWDELSEEELVFVHDEVRDEDDACSVLGEMGEVFALVVYLGAEGYDFFRKLRETEDLSTGDFFDGHRSVLVQYVRRTELTRQDRELLTVAAYPILPGALYPQFRTVRPGYQHWYVTENEARILAGGLEAMVTMCHTLAKPDCPDFWELEGIYPLMRRGEAGYTIRPVVAPEPTRTIPVAAPLEEARIQRILGGIPRVADVFEADHFYTGAPVGQDRERKACVRVALVVDGGSGYAYPPRVEMPEAATGAMLAGAVLTAIEDAHAIPREIRVRSMEYRILLEPLAAALGTKVKVASSMPALDAAKNALLEKVGDRPRTAPE